MGALTTSWEMSANNNEHVCHLESVMQDFHQITHSLQQPDSKVSIEIQSKRSIFKGLFIILYYMIFWVKVSAEYRVLIPHLDWVWLY